MILTYLAGAVLSTCARRNYVTIPFTAGHYSSHRAFHACCWSIASRPPSQRGIALHIPVRWEARRLMMSRSPSQRGIALHIHRAMVSRWQAASHDPLHSGALLFTRQCYDQRGRANGHDPLHSGALLFTLCDKDDARLWGRMSRSPSQRGIALHT